MSDDKQHTMPELRVDANGVIVSYHGKHLDMPEHAGPYPTPDLLAFRDEMAAGIASLRLQLSILEAELCELNECIVASKTLDLERNTG